MEQVLNVLIQVAIAALETPEITVPLILLAAAYVPGPFKGIFVAIARKLTEEAKTSLEERNRAKAEDIVLTVEATIPQEQGESEEQRRKANEARKAMAERLARERLELEEEKKELESTELDARAYIEGALARVKERGLVASQSKVANE